jgi:solute carrier family 25 (mitochondrial S-adenosylmethionine transporter), member 26
MKPRTLEWQQNIGIDSEALSHMTAASMGEVAACLVRVPTEVIKSKMQTGNSVGLAHTFRSVLQERHGIMGNVTGGLYRGYGITLMREIPFALIQFPLYEYGKRLCGDWQGGIPATPVQAAACGSLSGGVAAALTTPLDVLKTRLMLGADKNGVPYAHAMDVWKRTVAEEGMEAMFRGIQPRVMWISIGGFVFFGAYEGYKSILIPILD